MGLAFYLTGEPVVRFPPQGMFRAEIIEPHNADYYRTVQPILRLKVGVRSCRATDCVPKLLSSSTIVGSGQPANDEPETAECCEAGFPPVRPVG